MNNINIDEPTYKITGYLKCGYEGVLDLYQSYYINHFDDGSQLCIYDGEEIIINLSGYIKESKNNYNSESLQNIYSSGKVIESLIASMMVDRKLIEYDTPISDIWTEFSYGNKDKITLAHIMRHQSGLHKFQDFIPLSLLTKDKIKNNSLGNIIVKQQNYYEAGSKNSYHAFTRGWLLGEVLRRVDTKKRTLSEFLAEEITSPLGIENGMTIGLPQNIRYKNTKITKTSYFQTWLGTWLPNYKLPIDSNLDKLISFFTLPFKILLDFLGTYLCCCFINLTNYKSLNQIDTDEWLDAEISSVNIHANAKSFAKIISTMINGDNILISKDGMDKGLSNIVTSKLFGGQKDFNFTQGGFNLYKNVRLNFIGWTGNGGFVTQWHPEYNLTFVYLSSKLERTSDAQRGLLLQKELLRCYSILSK